MVAEPEPSSTFALPRSRRRIGPDNCRWIRTRHREFFLPVRVLSRMFRGKLLAFLKQSYRRGELCIAGRLAELSTPRAFHSQLGTLRRREWVVYSKPPLGGPEHVLKYLARYTHRVAISNGRLLSLENGQVRFRWRDSRRNNRSSVMKLDAVEFIRRFLLHVLPAGFVKIRHFGLLANRNRRQALALCRLHLRATAADPGSLLTEQQMSAGAGKYDLTLTAITAGVRYRPMLRSKWDPFGQILIGVANANGSLVEGNTPAAKNSTLNFASQVGGGLDYRLSPRFSLRIAEADYFLTTTSNGVNDHQNNLRVSSGFAYRFGRR
jgi:hypothetical protein